MYKGKKKEKGHRQKNKRAIHPVKYLPPQGLKHVIG